jgi:hypothetical protein
MPSLLDEKIYKITRLLKKNAYQDQNVLTLIYPKMEYTQTNKLAVIWNIITSELNSHGILPSHINHAVILKQKQSILDRIKPIEKWAIIPVIFKGQTYLAPISETNKIIYERTSSEIFNLFNSSIIPRNDNCDNFPLLHAEVLTKDALHVLSIILVNPLINEHMLVSLVKFQPIFENFFLFKSNDSYKMVQNYLKDCIEYPKPTRITFENEIKTFIKELPIFVDFFGIRKSLSNLNTKVYTVNLSSESRELIDFFNSTDPDSRKYDLLDFSNHKNLFFLDMNPEFAKVYRYLGLEEIRVERFYSMFFEWCTKDTPTGIQEILNDHVSLLYSSLDLDRLKKSAPLWNQLSLVPFIKIRDRFYSAKEVYSVSNLTLPENYRTSRWIRLLVELELGTEYSSIYKSLVFYFRFLGIKVQNLIFFLSQ